MADLEGTPTALESAHHNAGYSKGRKCLMMAIIMLLGLTNHYGSIGGTILLGPSIQESLRISSDELQWLTTSFYITLGCMCLVGGRLADIFGGKRTCVVGMTIFVLASLGACFAQTKEALFATRGLSGLGSALATVAAFPILIHIFPEGSGRTMAFALYIAAAPTGGGLGLFGSGFIADKDWRRYFYVLTGLTGLCALTILIFIPDVHPGHVDLWGQIDWIGSVLVTVGLVLLLYVFTMAPSSKDGWSTTYIIVLLVLACLIMGAFAMWEWRLERRNQIPPLLPLSVFALDRGRVALLFVITTFCFAGYSNFMYVTTLYFQEYLHLSLRKTSMHYLPGPITGIFCNVLVGFIAPIVPTQWILSFGGISTGMALVLFAIMPVSASYWSYTLPFMMLAVIGADFASSAGLIYITQVVKGPKSGMAGGLFQTFIQLGFCVGPSFGTLVLRYTAQDHAREKYSSGLSYDAEDFPPASYLHGLKMSAWVLASLCLFAGVIFPLALHGMGNSRTHGVQQKEEKEDGGEILAEFSTK